MSMEDMILIDIIFTNTLKKFQHSNGATIENGTDVAPAITTDFTNGANKSFEIIVSGGS